MAMLGNIITSDRILRGDMGNQEVFPRFSNAFRASLSRV
jgi:hypothetical protein